MGGYLFLIFSIPTITKPKVKIIINSSYVEIISPPYICNSDFSADITKRLNRFLTFTPFVYEVVRSFELVFTISRPTNVSQELFIIILSSAGQAHV